MDGDAAAVVDLQALLPGPVAYLLVLVVCGGPADAGWPANVLALGTYGLNSRHITGQTILVDGGVAMI